MNIFNIEKFLFCKDIIYYPTANENPKEIQINDKSSHFNLKLLCTITSFYFFITDYKTVNPKTKNKDNRRISTISSNLKLVRTNSFASSKRGPGITMHPSSKQQRNLEDFILLKVNLNDLVITYLNIETVTLVYELIKPGIEFQNPFHMNCNKIEGLLFFTADKSKIRFTFKINSQKEKDIIKILTLIEGYKYATKVTLNQFYTKGNQGNNKDLTNIHYSNKGTIYAGVKNNYSSLNNSAYYNKEYLHKIIDGLFENNFKLIINNEFFDEEESKVLKKFTDFLAFIPDIIIKCILYDEDILNNNSLKPSQTKTNNKLIEEEVENYANAFHDRFNLDKNDPAFYAVLYNFQRIKASNIYLNERAFFRVILPLMDKSPKLMELDISNGLLSNIILDKLTESKYISLKILNLSKNKISSDNLHNSLINLVKHFIFLEKINFSGNLISNEFLKKLNIINLNKLIVEINNITTQIHRKLSIDLRDNYFEKHILIHSFYLWNKNIYQEFSSKINYTDQELNDKSTNIEKMNNSVFDIYMKEYSNILLMFNYPYFRMSSNYIQSNPTHKLTLRSKCLNMLNNLTILDLQTKDNHINEMELYHKWFIFFFLIDYYFDPILNSFNHSRSVVISRKKEYANESNQKEIFNELYLLSQLSKNELNKLIDVQETYYAKYKRKSSLITSFGTVINPIQYRLFPFEIDSYHAYEMVYMFKKLITAKRNINIITNLVFNNKNPLSQQLNPNTFIDDLFCFYQFVNDNYISSSITIPISSLFKLLNRIKIETYLSLHDNNINHLALLTKITTNFKMIHLNNAIKEKYDIIKQKCQFIDKGLIKIINFIGRDLYNSNKDNDYLVECNNYLDIFIKEAELIYYNSDAVCIARYIQYLRNNKLRLDFYFQYEQLLKVNGLSSYVQKINNDYDELYRKYKLTINYKQFNIPEKIKCKTLCYHPDLVDYLKVSETSYTDLENDLEIIKEEIFKRNEVLYGIRNIYDRIRFLMLKNSIKKYPERYGYSLNRNNTYLNITRVLFRINNRLNHKDIFRVRGDTFLTLPENNKFRYIDTPFPIHPSKFDIIYQTSNFNLRTIETKEKSIKQINKVKLTLLLCGSLRDVTIFNIEKEEFNFTEKEKNFYYSFTTLFYQKLLKIITIENIKIQNWNFIYRKIKELLRYYLKFKPLLIRNNENTYSNKNSFWYIFNKELFFLLYKFCNRDKYEFKQQNDQMKYSFGLFYLFMFYLEFGEGFIALIKSFICHLYINQYYSLYCEKILNALNCPYRYNHTMSSYEINQRLEKEKIMIDVFFYVGYSEQYEINELTTVNDLYNVILEKSKIMNDISEKNLYWLFLEENAKGWNWKRKDENKKQTDREEGILKEGLGIEKWYLKGSDFILEILGKVEEYILSKISKKLNKKNSEEYNSDVGEEEENIDSIEEDGINEKDLLKDYYLNNAIEESLKQQNESKDDKSQLNIKSFDKFPHPNNLLDDVYFKPSIIFEYFHFVFHRRIFSPTILSGGIPVLSQNEQEILFSQLSYTFATDRVNYTVQYDLGKKIGICLLVNRRLFSPYYLKDPNGKFDLEANISVLFPNHISSHSIFKKLPLNELLQERISSTKTHTQILNEFFLLTKKLPFLYASTFKSVIITKIVHDIKPLNSSFVEGLKIIVMLYSDYIELLDDTSYKQIYKFYYYDIVNLKLIDQSHIKISFIFIDELNLNGKEMRIILDTINAYFILEEILSYMQYYLCRKTKSELVDCFLHTRQSMFDINHIKESNLKGFKLIYQRMNSNEVLNKKLVMERISNEIQLFKNTKENDRAFILYKENEKHIQKEKEAEAKKTIHEKEEIQKKLQKEEEKRVGKFDVRKVFKFSPLTGEPIKQNKEIILNLDYSSLGSSDSFFEEISVHELKKNKEKIILDEKTQKKKTKPAAKKTTNKNLNFYMKDWIISEEDEDEINNQIEEERAKWSKRMDNSENSFNISVLSKSEKEENLIMTNGDNIKKILNKKFEEIFSQFYLIKQENQHELASKKSERNGIDVKSSKNEIIDHNSLSIRNIQDEKNKQNENNKILGKIEKKKFDKSQRTAIVRKTNEKIENDLINENKGTNKNIENKKSKDDKCKKWNQ